MAYYGPYGVQGGGGGGWYYGGVGGGARYMYGRGAVPGAGILGAGAGAAGWSQAVPAAATTSMQGGNQWGWGVGEEQRAPPLAMIRRETMGAAEAAADEVLVRLHPTEAAEKRRQEVIAYAKQLIGTYFGCEVFAFGSVPLKTYLPDGDIDLTVLTNTSLDATFIDDVRRLLKTEQLNTDSRFEVQKMKFINAEVKLIKCVIGNIIVDISFNQVGGVSTLCFLELVDSEVGKDHLFKRSIMLIKAWCYNECHILGAHHWLLSTYALEILVLHIFNVFHKSLHGPLEALYKFLEYYSKFEWDKYALSLDGPVPLSSLHNFAAEPTATNDDLLLGKEPLKGSLDRLLQLPRDSDKSDSKFRVKHLNIIDPLKCSNNLGRSVNKENYYRIRSAFSSGAQMLGQILLLPSELIPDEIYGFFENTLKRYGGGERQDLVTSALLQSPETELSEDVSSSETSNINEDENRSPDDSLELPDKESKVKPDDAKDRPWNKSETSFTAHSSFPPENGNSSIKQCYNNCETEEDLPISTPSMQEQHVLTSSTRTNTLGVSNSCPDNNSNCTDANQENLLLPFFSPSNLLDLSGDLGQHLGCLRLVQYNLEALFDKFRKSVQEASAAGLLNEELFKITALKFLSDTDAAPPQLSLASSTDTQRRNLSPVYCSHSTVDVPQQLSTDLHVDSVHQQNVTLSSGTQVTPNGWSSSPPPVADAEIYNVPCIYATEDIPETHGVVAYMPDTIVPLSSGIADVVAVDLAMSPSLTAYSEGYHDSWFDMTGCLPKTRGTGTYIPRTYGLYKDYNPRRHRHRQPNHIQSSGQRTSGESARSQTPMRQNTSQKHVPRAAHFKARASTGAAKQTPAGQTWKALNSQPRAEYGSRVAPASQPPRLAVPHHGDNAQGNHLTVAATAAAGESSSPAAAGGKFSSLAAAGGQSSSLAFAAGESSKPAGVAGKSSPPAAAAGESSPPAAAAGESSKPAAAAGESSKPAAAVKDLKPLQEEKLEFGTLGPLSPTLLTPKFIEDFPPLPATKRPTASTLKSSWPAEAPASTVHSTKPGPTAAQIRPAESPASTVHSPKHGPTAAQTRPLLLQALASSRPEGVYRLKDEADFPPLQGGTR